MLSQFRFCESSGDIPADVMRLFAAEMNPAEGNALAAQWEASLTANDWPSWRTLAAVDSSGKTVAALVGRLCPGNLAAVWPPQVNSAATTVADAVCDALIQRAIDLFRREAVTLIQATFIPNDPGNERLERNQFQFAAELLYLTCPAEHFLPQAPVSELRFEDYQPSHRDELTQLIDATYQQTLDCPALNGVRTTTEVIDSYQATGGSGTKHWRLIRSGPELVGCLILAEHAPHGILELVYMGIAPLARGKGWGEIIVAYARWLSHELHMQQLVLTVDEKNHPARRIYEAAHFSIWDRRRVLLHFCR